MSGNGGADNDLLVLRDADEVSRPEPDALAGVVPHVLEEMVEALKVSVALPRGVAVATLGERLTDRTGARAVVAQPPLIRQASD